jgi:phytanoyl-CoA hydroxylase
VRRHPLNVEFAWSSPTAPFRRITAAQARAYDERGFFVLEDAFSSDELRAVLSEIDPVEARVEAFLQGVDGRRVFIARAGEITFTTHLVLRSAYLRRFVAGPVFQDLCFDLVGPDVRLYWDQAVYKKPGTESPFPWHQDNGYTFIEPQQYLTCWIALTDATEQNGCPWVVPGLHRLGTLAHELSDLGWVCLRDAPDAVPVPARAGSIVVFSSLTPHSTGANRTADVRKAYIVQFAPDGAATVANDEVPGSAPPGPANDPDRQFPILVAGTAVGNGA